MDGGLLRVVHRVQPCFTDRAGPDAVGLSIDKILVSGNEITRQRFVLKWAGIQREHIPTLPMLNNALLELRDTGLFKDIQFQTKRDENGELTLCILLEVKHYWPLLPRLSRNGDGDVKKGISLHMYNLNGVDQTLEFRAQPADESDGDDSEELRFRYIMPLFSRPYELKWQLVRKIESLVRTDLFPDYGYDVEAKDGKLYGGTSLAF